MEAKRLNIRGPIVGFQTSILSPVVNPGSIESLGILKEANRKTCMANHAVTSIHSKKVMSTVYCPIFFKCFFMLNPINNTIFIYKDTIPTIHLLFGVSGSLKCILVRMKQTPPCSTPEHSPLSFLLQVVLYLFNLLPTYNLYDMIDQP